VEWNLADFTVRRVRKLLGKEDPADCEMTQMGTKQV
jgi:hypothetical protein